MSSQFKPAEVRRITAFLRTIAVRFEPVQVAKTIKCPYCSRDIPCYWEPLYTFNPPRGDYKEGIELRDEEDGRPYERFDIRWMQCFSDDCGQVIVRVGKTRIDPRTLEPSGAFEEWLAVPRKRAPRPIDSLVPDEFSKPYVKASLILEDAPDMSGILSRRILADLLKKYANRPEKNLTNQIDAFFKETAHPSRVKENLHHLREIGNFGAHTQIDEATDEIIDVSPDEAEWTLSVLDGLFDYFIVGPERDKQRRASFDAKIKKAGRDPLAKPKS